MSNIGLRIKFLREQMCMTQAQLAKLVNVDRSYITKIENGDTDGSVRILRKLATALGVSIGELLEEKKDIKVVS